ncbi:MAG: ComEC/Rec2 family competence protein [Chitinophagaceae bacterium]
MPGYGSTFWKKAPFVKFLLALVAGILLEWYFPLSKHTVWIFLVAAFSFLCCFFFIPFFSRYRLSFLNGIIIHLLFFSLGALLVCRQDIRKDRQWLGNFYKETDALVVTLQEPPVEKTRSFKATALVNYLVRDGQIIPVKGTLLLYFNKDSPGLLTYGSQVLFKKSLQEIRSTGNPGGFDYKQYALFQGITHQVYLAPDEFELLPGKKGNWFREFLYSSREKILHILRHTIKGDKETGLAEALLIGYKNDLDQSLIQSYTNTGVVHIIAISGLHLGLIYWLLALLLKPLQAKKKLRWLRPVLIISGLWLFSLLAGAQPSILRSALMLTCIVAGESLSKRTSIYNTMALSAFILLCVDPFWLWDVGFQLSYTAVLSIIIFMRPIYNWFYIKNKLLDSIWKLNAVTLAAQILTVPLSLCYFHQFPSLFLFTNFLAVPLSSLILLGEILLCVISFIPAAAFLVGKLVTCLIQLMNTYIENIELIRFSLWDGLQVTFIQAILLLLFIAGAAYWLMERSANGLKWGLCALLGFSALRSFSFIESNKQDKLIVYNAGQKKAIDIIDGRKYYFTGDSSLLTDDFARHFYLEPSRVLYRVQKKEWLEGLCREENYLDYHGKHILLVDKALYFDNRPVKPVIDLLVISKNPKLYLEKIAASLDIKLVIFDGSVPAWKARYWKRDCDSLRIPWHDVNTAGAFVMNTR